jgi:hypothetical protein
MENLFCRGQASARSSTLRIEDGPTGAHPRRTLGVPCLSHGAL